MRRGRQPELTFPFWMLVYRGEDPWRPVMLTPGYIAAFSAHGRAAAFAVGQGDPAWEFRLVVRPTFLRMADWLRREGVVGVHLDPDAGGEVIDLDRRGAEAPAPPVRRSTPGTGRRTPSVSLAGS
jgi:hypothetical protein